MQRLENTLKLLSKEKLEKDDFISWAAYQASKSTLLNHKPAIISLLPMFIENAHSVDMMFKEIFNEDQFVIMLGGLHIEMAAHKSSRKMPIQAHFITPFF